MKKEEKVNGAFVGVDEKYIPNNSTEEKNTYVKENKGTKRADNIYLIVFAIFFILIFGTTIFGMVHVFSTMNKMEKDFKEDKSSTIEEVKETQKEMINDAKETQNNIQENNEQVEETKATNNFDNVLSHSRLTNTFGNMPKDKLEEFYNIEDDFH